MVSKGQVEGNITKDLYLIQQYLLWYLFFERRLVIKEVYSSKFHWGMNMLKLLTWRDGRTDTQFDYY